MSGSASLKVKAKWTRSGCNISFKGEISFESRVRPALRVSLSQGKTSFEGEFESRQDQLQIDSRPALF